MQTRGEVRSATHGRVLFLDRLKPLAPADQARLDRLVAMCEEAQFRPPTLAEIVDAIDQSAAAIDSLMARAIDEGLVDQVGDHFYGASIVKRSLVEIYRNCVAHDEELHIPELRDALGTSRKFLIPLLEYVDSLGMTQLRGGVRRLLQTSPVCQQIADAVGGTA
jgi:selenocysteine-specific elongation factor